jgi:hypothetical protein
MPILYHTSRQIQAAVAEVARRSHMQEQVDRREFEEFKHYLDQKFKELHIRVLLYIGAAVGIIRFDIPKEATAAAIGAIFLKVLVASIHRS